MLYHLFFSLHEKIGAFNVFRYLTFRSMLAFFLALLFVLIAQPHFIRWVKGKQFGQPIRDDGPQSHQRKAGTPTMGGVVLVFAVICSTLLLADLQNVYIWTIVGVTLGFAILGFIDDYRKIRQRNSKGLSARVKLGWQFAIALLAIIVLLLFVPDFSTSVTLPLFKNVSFALGLLFIPFAALVIVACSNAVNLTDGLDGLVIGPVMTVAFAYGIFAYVGGNSEIARYLQIAYIRDCGDLSIFAAAIIAAGLGFLWFNSFPASVFMGDVGSLALGAALGMLAVITKQELVLIIAGGVFVLEALSVMAQVISFKTTGKRVLRMAPLHHHFELGGIQEPKIIVRCWIISIVLALVSIATLKLR